MSRPMVKVQCERCSERGQIDVATPYSMQAAWCRLCLCGHENNTLSVREPPPATGKRASQRHP